MQGRTERVALDKIVPYWRNPRILSTEAVEAVKSSITEYGYNQPIVVDKDFVIIIGHTRYAALRRLEVPEADVLVADHLGAREVKELRVIDNRAGEYSLWDFDKLQEEVVNTDNQLLIDLFPEILSQMDDQPGQSTPVEWGPGDEEDDFSEVDFVTPFVCPSCFNEWEVEVTREQVLSGTIKTEKEVGE